MFQAPYMMNELNDTNEDITGFREGKAGFVYAVIGEFYPSLFNFAKELIRDQGEARDIVIMTFIKLLTRRTYFEQLPDIKAFLFINARNTCMDFLHHQGHYHHRDEPAICLQESDLDFSDKMVKAEAERLLWASMEDLSTMSRQVVRLLFVEGLQTGVVARQLGIDGRDVLNYRKTGVHQLQNILLEHNLFSIPFFIHFLAIGCRSQTPEAKVFVPINR